jgi:RNA polymerase sigma factor (TIGR02999 family)
MGAAATSLDMSEITVLLRAAGADQAALARLFELLYSDLRRMAHARLAEHSRNTLLDTTSLAHEAYLRLHNAGRIDVDSRGRFMAYVSQVLRAIIVDFARKRNAQRRGGSERHVTLNTNVAEEVSGGGVDVEGINDALIELEKTDPRLKQVVEMRYFGGMTEPEIAEALGITERTVRRDWKRAQLLLSVALKR